MRKLVALFIFIAPFQAAAVEPGDGLMLAYFCKSESYLANLESAIIDSPELSSKIGPLSVESGECFFVHQGWPFMVIRKIRTYNDPEGPAEFIEAVPYRLYLGGYGTEKFYALVGAKPVKI